MGKFNLVDFDKKSHQYVNEWLEKNLKEENGKTVDQLEEEAPLVYAAWAKKESRYFDDFSGAELVEMLSEYIASDISVPDLLCERIIKKKEDTEAPLYQLYAKGMFSAEDRIMMINMLSAMDSALPLQDFITLIWEQEEDTEVINAAAEALRFMTTASASDILNAFDNAEKQAAKELFMNALVYQKSAPAGLTDRLIKLLSDSTSKAFVAGMMTQYGDDDCLPILYEAEQALDIDYIDYTEICNAIEALGGNTDRSRDFEGDSYYDMLKNYTMDGN